MSPRIPRHGLLAALATLLLIASAPLPAQAARCPVSEGPIRARVALPGGAEAIARDGALLIDGEVITPCDGLPGAFPTAVAWFDGRLWVGFRAAGLYHHAATGFVRVAGLPTDAIRALSLSARADGLWVGTGASGLWRVDAAGAASRFDHRILGRREVSALALASDGTLHVGAGMYGWWRVSPEGTARRRQRGVYAACFTGSGRRLTPTAPGPGCDLGPAPAASGLPSSHLTSLATHRGRLVVGTFDRGLAERTPDGRFQPVAGSPPFINALLVDGDVLWLATPKGLHRRDATGPVRRVPLGLPSEHVNGLALGLDGTLWLATGRGLHGLGPDGALTTYDTRHGLPSRIVYSVAVTDDGAVWAGTAQGAARIAPEGLTTYTQASGALTHDWVNALLADGDTVLAGTYDAGVVRLSPDGGGAVEPGLESLWVNPGGLAWLPGGRLAVSTLGDGLVVQDGARVREPGPLPSRDVTAALIWRGELWVATRGGLVVGVGAEERPSARPTGRR